MQITFLVGNGFDISCGLNTSYDDFYKWYCKQEESELSHVNAFRKAIDLNKENWADFEEALGQYTKHFTVDTIQQFIECYEDASKRLMEYLQQESNRFEEEIIEEELEKFRIGLKNFYFELRPTEKQSIIELINSHKQHENITMSFISFNYTYTLDHCVKRITNVPLDNWNNSSGHKFKFVINPNVIHAHGSLSRNPVFGVNDESQIANKELLSVPDFASLMIKPKCVKELCETWHDEIDALIDSSNIICIYGMSMGITDTIWFTKIMKWLNGNESRHVILYWHTKQPSDNVSNVRYFANRRRAREKIAFYSNLDHINLESLSQRIHVIENTKEVLQMKLTEKIDADKYVEMFKEASKKWKDQV